MEGKPWIREQVCVRHGDGTGKHGAAFSLVTGILGDAATPHGGGVLRCQGGLAGHHSICLHFAQPIHDGQVMRMFAVRKDWLAVLAYRAVLLVMLLLGSGCKCALWSSMPGAMAAIVMTAVVLASLVVDGGLAHAVPTVILFAMGVVDDMALLVETTRGDAPLVLARAPTGAPGQEVLGCMVSSWLWDRFVVDVFVVPQQRPGLGLVPQPVLQPTARPPGSSEPTAVVGGRRRPMRRLEKKRRQTRDRLAQVPDDNCCLCLEGLLKTRGAVVRLRCDHHIHDACMQSLQAWWGTQCPLCTAPMEVRYQLPTVLTG